MEPSPSETDHAPLLGPPQCVITGRYDISLSTSDANTNEEEPMNASKERERGGAAQKRKNDKIRHGGVSSPLGLGAQLLVQVGFGAEETSEKNNAHNETMTANGENTTDASTCSLSAASDNTANTTLFLADHHTVYSLSLASLIEISSDIHSRDPQVRVPLLGVLQGEVSMMVEGLDAGEVATKIASLGRVLFTTEERIVGLHHCCSNVRHFTSMIKNGKGEEEEMVQCYPPQLSRPFVPPSSYSSSSIKEHLSFSCSSFEDVCYNTCSCCKEKPRDTALWVISAEGTFTLLNPKISSSYPSTNERGSSFGADATSASEKKAASVVVASGTLGKCVSSSVAMWRSTHTPGVFVSTTDGELSEVFHIFLDKEVRCQPPLYSSLTATTTCNHGAALERAVPWDYHHHHGIVESGSTGSSFLTSGGTTTPTRFAKKKKTTKSDQQKQKNGIEDEEEIAQQQKRERGQRSRVLFVEEKIVVKSLFRVADCVECMAIHEAKPSSGYSPLSPVMTTTPPPWPQKKEKISSFQTSFLYCVSACGNIDAWDIHLGQEVNLPAEQITVVGASPQDKKNGDLFFLVPSDQQERYYSYHHRIERESERRLPVEVHGKPSCAAFCKGNLWVGMNDGTIFVYENLYSSSSVYSSPLSNDLGLGDHQQQKQQQQQQQQYMEKPKKEEEDNRSSGATSTGTAILHRLEYHIQRVQSIATVGLSESVWSCGLDGLLVVWGSSPTALTGCVNVVSSLKGQSASSRNGGQKKKGGETTSSRTQNTEEEESNMRIEKKLYPTFPLKGVFEVHEGNPMNTVLNIQEEIVTKLWSLDTTGYLQTWRISEPVIPRPSPCLIAQDSYLFAQQQIQKQKIGLDAWVNTTTGGSDENSRRRQGKEAKEETEGAYHQRMQEVELEKEKTIEVLVSLCHALESSQQQQQQQPSPAQEEIKEWPLSICERVPDVPYLSEAIFCMTDCSKIVTKALQQVRQKPTDVSTDIQCLANVFVKEHSRQLVAKTFSKKLQEKFFSSANLQLELYDEEEEKRGEQQQDGSNEKEKTDSKIDEMDRLFAVLDAMLEMIPNTVLLHPENDNKEEGEGGHRQQQQQLAPSQSNRNNVDAGRSSGTGAHHQFSFIPRHQQQQQQQRTASPRDTPINRKGESTATAACSTPNTYHHKDERNGTRKGQEEEGDNNTSLFLQHPPQLMNASLLSLGAVTPPPLNNSTASQSNNAGNSNAAILAIHAELQSLREAWGEQVRVAERATTRAEHAERLVEELEGRCEDLRERRQGIELQHENDIQSLQRSLAIAKERNDQLQEEVENLRGALEEQRYQQHNESLTENQREREEKQKLQAELRAEKERHRDLVNQITEKEQRLMMGMSKFKAVREELEAKNKLVTELVDIARQNTFTIDELKKRNSLRRDELSKLTKAKRFVEQHLEEKEQEVEFMRETQSNILDMTEGLIHWMVTGPPRAAADNAIIEQLKAIQKLCSQG